MSKHDTVDRANLQREEIASLRKDLRVRFAVFISISVLLVLASMYDNNMLKVLLMFLQILLFYNFLKHHLRMKYDIEEGEKCLEIIEIGPSPHYVQTVKGKAIKLRSAYGQLHVTLKSKAPPQPGDTLLVTYLPLSNHVIDWQLAQKKAA